MLRQISCALFISGLLIGCGDDKPSDPNTTGLTGVVNGMDGGAGDGGNTSDGGGNTSDGGGNTSDGGGNTSDGGGSTSDGGGSTSDGGGSTSDGGGSTSDGGGSDAGDGGSDAGDAAPMANDQFCEIENPLGGCETQDVRECVCGNGPTDLDLPECCQPETATAGEDGWSAICIEIAFDEGCFGGKPCLSVHDGNGCWDMDVQDYVCNHIPDGESEPPFAYCCNPDDDGPANIAGWNAFCKGAAESYFAP